MWSILIAYEYSNLKSWFSPSGLCMVITCLLQRVRVLQPGLVIISKSRLKAKVMKSSQLWGIVNVKTCLVKPAFLLLFTLFLSYFSCFFPFDVLVFFLTYSILWFMSWKLLNEYNLLTSLVTCKYCNVIRQPFFFNCFLASLLPSLICFLCSM